jgi:hypothetical protein
VSTRTATVGLYCLRCACGKDVHILDVLERTETGRETVRHFCWECGCISWWWRVSGPPEKVMLIDREERSRQRDEWPPRGWMHRHCPARKR